MKPITYYLIAPFVYSTTVLADAPGADVEEITVVSQRLAPLAARKAFSTSIIDRDTIEKSSAVSLDQLLASKAGISLFRRADSASAHPTTTGVNMRGVGANAAGRALILLDGVPLNDPFGGWITWSAFQTQTFDSIEVRRGGGAGQFGGSALSGVVSLESGAPAETAVAATAEVGSFGYQGGSARVDLVGDRSFLSLSGGKADRDGFHLLSEEQRGSIDIPAASDSAFVTLRAGTRIGDDVSATMRVAWYEENRNNGLSLANSETEGLDVSARLVREASAGQNGFEFTAFYRDRDFTNSFSSVRDDYRTIERKVLDQYDMPGKGTGLLAKVRHIASDSLTVEAGVDVRIMSGSTNEQYKNLGAGFLNDRKAGGKQSLAGAFAEAMVETEGWSVTAGARLDAYNSHDGYRIETKLSDDSITREDTIADTNGFMPSARLGVSRNLTGAITFEGAVYNSFRLPTINEYYRPFRVRNDITEANPDLDIEKIVGLEAGISYQPISTIKLSARLYRLWMEDTVGNVTLAYGPGFFAPTGFVPGGGVLRQRANIDNTVTDGFELLGSARLSDALTVEGSYQFADARITAFAANADLVGKRPVQTPKHSLRASATWQPEGPVWARVEGQYDSDIYDDDVNTRRIDDILLANAVLGVQVNENITMKASVRNLFDSKVVSALSSTGLETLAQPQTWRLSLGMNF